MKITAVTSQEFLEIESIFKDVPPEIKKNMDNACRIGSSSIIEVAMNDMNLSGDAFRIKIFGSGPVIEVKPESEGFTRIVVMTDYMGKSMRFHAKVDSKKSFKVECYDISNKHLRFN